MTAIGTLLLVVLGLSGVLAFSAVMKWRDPRGSVAAVAGFKIPARFSGAVALGLPIVELALAAGLLLLPGVLFAVVAWLVFLLFAAFTVVVGAALARGDSPVCHCFGELSHEPIGRMTMVRNVLLTVLALVVAIMLGAPNWPGLLTVLATLSGDLLTEVVVLVSLTIALTALWSRQARLQARVLAQDLRLATLETALAPSDAGPQLIPELNLLSPDGAAVSLVELSDERATMLLFVSPGCGHCGAVLARLPEWRRELEGIVTLQPVSIGSVQDTMLAFPDVTDTLFDLDRHAMTRLGSAGTPSAVLLGTNGYVGGGPSDGPVEIEKLVDGVIEAIAMNREQHTAMPGDDAEPALPTFDATLTTTQAAWDGAELPSAPLTHEDGSVADLRRAVGDAGRRALVFWRSDCAYCESILPEVRDASASGRAVLVTTSNAASVRAQGIDGSLYLSPDRAALAAMQVPGTPVGFLVDGHRVLAGPFIGADAVRDLVTGRTAG